MTIPPVSTYALGYGAFLGLYANLRYQLLCGIDRAVVNHFDVIGVALVFSTALRFASSCLKKPWIFHTFLHDSWDLLWYIFYAFEIVLIAHVSIKHVKSFSCWYFLLFCICHRILNAQVGETSRLAWLGLEPDPLVQSDDLLKAYNRSSSGDATESSSKWFISKKALVSGLGLLGIKQGNADSIIGESPAPKVRRKRVVRKKVSASEA